MSKENYINIPNELIYKEVYESEILVYIGIAKRRLLFDKMMAVTSIFDLCELSNYSTTDRRKGSFFSSIKFSLQRFRDMGLIEFGRNIQSVDDIRPQGLLQINLTKNFDIEEKYTMITEREINSILNCKTYNSLSSILRTYLYVKSFMLIDYKHPENAISAYYVARKIAANTLKMSLPKYDGCLETLCDLGLLICHQTGSYYTYHGITNAPNIYVLNNDNAMSNVRGALNRLKQELLKPEFGNKDDFMPMVYIGKKIGVRIYEKSLRF